MKSEVQEQPRQSKNVLKKIVTTVFPNKLIPKEMKSPSSLKGRNKTSEPLRDLSNTNVYGSAVSIPESSFSLQTRSRASTTSASHKLEYNPYGIYNYHDISSLGSAFGNGIKKSEPDLRLTGPLLSPNDYLPESLRQSITNLEDKYEVLDNEIALGGSATIKKIVLINAASKSSIYALKKFSVFTGESQEKYYNRVSLEFIITKRYSQLHSIKCYDLMQLPITLQNAWGMVMDFYEYDLYKLIKNSEWKNVSFEEKMCIFKQICFGIKYLHENDIAHLDIKADNVLISKNGIMKIADYGCSEPGHKSHGDFESPVAMKTKRLGTPPYQPPEVAKYNLVSTDSREPFSPFYFDYWSLGVLLFILVIGRVPFVNAKDSDPAFKLYTLEYMRFLEKNPYFSQDINSKIPTTSIFMDHHGKNPNFIYLFWRLCDPTPKTRMTIPKLFKNKFFQNLNMCIDEKIYECNFYCHSRSKNMSFEIPINSDEEISHQKEIRHSLWDDLPTIISDCQKYDSLVTKVHNHCQMHPSTTKKGISILNHSSALSPVKDDDEINSTNVDLKLDTLMTSGSLDKDKSELSFENSGRNIFLQNRAHNYTPYMSTRHYFSDDDYSKHDKMYMIVSFQDIINACNYQITAHSHNMFYSYKPHLNSNHDRNRHASSNSVSVEGLR